tara:strand:- start:1147 stop:1302 length:156 start_codon:yes stop_codon:yes gene_type:complete
VLDRTDEKKKRAKTRHRNLVAKDSPYKPKRIKSVKKYKRVSLLVDSVYLDD